MNISNKILGELIDQRTKLFNKEPISYDDFIFYMKIISSQKFSNVFQKEMIKVAEYSTTGNNFSKFDAFDEYRNIEIKYATYDQKRGASFPQIIRKNIIPDEYIISIFFDNDIEIYRLSGNELHSSIINRKATNAHNNNSNEVRINIKLDIEEMIFLKKYRDLELENKFRQHIFCSNEE